MTEASSGSFTDRLFKMVESRGSCLVVGLDPVLESIPEEITSTVRIGGLRGQGETARASAIFGRFLEGVLDAVSDFAVAVKPNTAFFERWGPPGWDCLTTVCRKARERGLLVIADAKRGDIGHTAEAYADALLGDLPDTPGPCVDAVTISPYLGSDSVEPFLRRCRERGKGLFVLVRTSNPSAADLQHLECEGRPLYLHVAGLVSRWGRGTEGSLGLSSVGAVVGATAPEEARRVREAIPTAPFLVPGYGAQGAAAEDLAPCFLPGGLGAVVNASRSVIFAHKRREGPWQEAVGAAAREARDDLERVRRKR